MMWKISTIPEIDELHKLIYRASVTHVGHMGTSQLTQFWGYNKYTTTNTLSKSN